MGQDWRWSADTGDRVAQQVTEAELLALLERLTSHGWEHEAYCYYCDAIPRIFFPDAADASDAHSAHCPWAEARRFLGKPDGFEW